jgi:hypothetical protein
MRFLAKAVLLAGACALAVALMPDMSEAQTKSKAKVVVPQNGCAIAGAALEHGQTCAAKCDANQWCPVNMCITGKLEQTFFSCYDPSGVCTPKC